MQTNWPKMEHIGRDITEAEVAAFEHRLKRKLPAAYREFLLAVNGGRLADENCVFAQGVVNYLFSLGDDAESDNLEIQSTRARPTSPSPELLFVGYDGTGGNIFVALAPDRFGEVWYQRPSDTRPADANPRVLWHDRRDMKKLAPNWRDFMANLGPIS